MPLDPRRIEVIDDRTAEILRRMTPEERVERGLAMGNFGRAIIEAGVRHRHPDRDDTQVREAVLRRFRGD